MRLLKDVRRESGDEKALRGFYIRTTVPPSRYPKRLCISLSLDKHWLPFNWNNVQYTTIYETLPCKSTFGAPSIPQERPTSPPSSEILPTQSKGKEHQATHISIFLPQRCANLHFPDEPHWDPLHHNRTRP